MNFMGSSYSSAFVSSKGHVTFGAPFTGFSAFDSDFFAQPIIAPLDTDLQPGNGGQVYFDVFTDHVTITYNEVVGGGLFTTAGPSNVQMVLYPSVVITFHYAGVGSGLIAMFVGVGNGGAEPYPPPVDFVTP